MAKLSQSLEKKFGENGTRTLEMKLEKEKKAEEKKKREERKLAPPKESKPQKLVVPIEQGPTIITPPKPAYKEAREEREDRFYTLVDEHENTQEQRIQAERKLFRELGLAKGSPGYDSFAILDTERLAKDLEKMKNKLANKEFVYFDEVFKPNYYYGYSGLKTWAQDLREIPVSFFNGEICEGFEGFVLGSLTRSNNKGFNASYHFFHLPFLYDDFCARGDINASKKIVEAIISLYRKGIITIKNYTEKLMDSEVLQSMISSKCIRLTEKGYKKLTGEFASPHSYIRIPVYYRMFYYPIFNLRDILVYSVLRQYTKAGYECLLKYFPDNENNIFSILGISSQGVEQSLNKLYHLKVIDIRNLKKSTDKYDKIFITFLVNFEIPQPKEVEVFIYKEKDLGKKYNDYMRNGRELWKNIMKPFREAHHNKLYPQQKEFITRMYDSLNQLIDDMTPSFEGEENLRDKNGNRSKALTNAMQVVNRQPTYAISAQDIRVMADISEDDFLPDKDVYGDSIEKTFDDGEIWFRK